MERISYSNGLPARRRSGETRLPPISLNEMFA
jgi:hypothetical protein